MMLEGAGFKVTTSVAMWRLRSSSPAVEEHGAQIVGISALMTTTMPAMKAHPRRPGKGGASVTASR